MQTKLTRLLSRRGASNPIGQMCEWLDFCAVMTWVWPRSHSRPA